MPGEAIEGEGVGGEGGGLGGERGSGGEGGREGLGLAHKEGAEEGGIMEGEGVEEEGGGGGARGDQLRFDRCVRCTRVFLFKPLLNSMFQHHASWRLVNFRPHVEDIAANDERRGENERP
jgi:hypothetical protein